jgi:hypothetical protein
MAETAAQKKARLAAADNAAIQAAGIAKGKAYAAEEARNAEYAASLEDPITSQYDPRIAENAGYNPEMDATQMTSSGVAPEVKKEDKKLLAGGTKYTATDGSVFEDFAAYERYQGYLDEKADISSTKKRSGESAYALLYQEFAQYGLGGLVEPLQAYIQDGLSPAEFTLRLRETEPYKKRFAANAQRIAKGLTALSEAEYIGLEDQYQNIMRNYGLPANYYERGAMGVQPGFEKFLANDVSATELEDRITTAQTRVLNANPEVSQALKTFYPGITNGDILAYTLDPTKGLEDIKRKVTAAEIGGAAARAGLSTNVADAEYLQRYGVDKATADKGYSAIGSGLQRGSQLAAIYGEDPYTQSTAEQEIFNVPGAADARKKREKLAGLEQATFSAKTGVSSSAIARDRAGGY